MKNSQIMAFIAIAFIAGGCATQKVPVAVATRTAPAAVLPRIAHCPHSQVGHVKVKSVSAEVVGTVVVKVMTVSANHRTAIVVDNDGNQCRVELPTVGISATSLEAGQTIRIGIRVGTKQVKGTFSVPDYGFKPVYLCIEAQGTELGVIPMTHQEINQLLLN